MGDFRSIGGVSATLQRLLIDRIEIPDGIEPPTEGGTPMEERLTITIGPPPFSARDTEPHRENPRVNLFLYRVTENGFLQNQEIPGRGASSGYGHPPLSVDLHYLVTAYGNEEKPSASALFDDTKAHFLLGSAMRVMHDIPTITESLTSVRPPSGEQILHESLRDTYERVKLSLEPLTLEDITKVWTALALRYRLSAAYAVNVVQIESRRRRTFPRPVGQPVDSVSPPPATDQTTSGPHVFVVTIQTPTISHIWVRRDNEADERHFPYARVGDALILYGTSLSGPVTSVAFGDLMIQIDDAGDVRPERLSVALPDNPALQPGVRTVKVITRDPVTTHGSFTSNEAAFVLVPRVDTVTYAAGPSRTLIIAGNRLIPAGAGGETVIGRSTVPRADYLIATPDRIELPVPVALPARNVPVLIGEALGDPVPVGSSQHELTITIGAVGITVTAATLSDPLPRDRVPGILQRLIRDADSDSPPFARAFVALSADRLHVVAGDLSSPVTITSPAGSSFATGLGFAGAPPPQAAFAAVSGQLGSVAALSSATPRLRVGIGAHEPREISLAAAPSLIDLATDMQTQLNAAAEPAYRDARVLSFGGRLVLIPGTPEAVSFQPVPGDDTSVGELLLHANFAVRVRVNGAESIDALTVELPQ